MARALEDVFDDDELSLYIKQQENDYTEVIAKAWLAYPNITVFSVWWQPLLDSVSPEPEKLYIVEIAGVGSNKLFKNIQTNKYLFHSGKGLKGYTDRLTEMEIKQKDERLWQFAKPVEDK